MPLPISGQIGIQLLGDGLSSQPLRQGRQGEGIFSELHGRFYEQTFRGTLFSNGMTVTSISNATFTTGTLGATCTPVLGVWNPSTSTVNAVILQAKLAAILTALQATGAGAFVWAMSTGNAALTLGTAPLNRRTLVQSGSSLKGLAGIALTGLTNSLVVMEGSGLSGGANYNASLLGTAVGFMPPPVVSVDNIDGSIIVVPGAVLALLATTTPVAVSAASSLLWEEVPV